MWEQPRWLVAFIMAVVVADAAAIGVAETAKSASFRSHDLVLFGILVACNAATVELTRRAGEPTGVIRDVYAVWELPVVVLLPISYALITPVVRWALTQWRVRRAPVYRRVFTAAALSLAYGSASLTFSTMSRVTVGAATATPVPGTHAFAWILAVAACGAVQWGINATLVLTAIKGANPASRVRDMLFGREALYNDVTELCVAVLVAFGVAGSLVTLVFAFPFVTLLQRSHRHAQLVNDSRLDSKTGLLNAGTWEREAAVEVARAVRAQTPLAVALLDIDHFKVVNDTHGHLVGDHTLREIARTFKILLREYDLAGRFGGEEFVLLLPHTHDLDAYHIAERMRAHIAALPIYATEDGAEPVRVTVSIGVAALDGTRRELTDLLAAADVALYRAKQGGRDRVHLINAAAAMAGGGDLGTTKHGQG